MAGKYVLIKNDLRLTLQSFLISKGRLGGVIMATFNLEKTVSKCRNAARALALLTSEEKNKILAAFAKALRSNTEKIIKENTKDIKAGEKKKLSKAMLDRLLLNEKRIEEMAGGLEEVINLPDPVGIVVKEYQRPNGLTVKRVRIPLGVIGVIYESRPNVTVDAAGLCFKSGNAVVLRGGSEAIYSNKILGQILQAVLKTHKIPIEAITVIPSTDRGLLTKLLKLSQYIDVLIPRGGESLMRFMEENSKIPVIKHDKGVCNLFVDSDADLTKAIPIIANAKAQRPGVCNALENLLVHEKIAKHFLPLLQVKLTELGVELRGDEKAKKILKKIKKATKADWSTEYLDLILAVKVVKNADEAINFIQTYGSHHTEAILTENKSLSDRFIRSLDSSCIVVNASTRFNDGGQLGLGAEIGISTTKLHAYGPMGLEELTTTQFVVYGEGQIRG